MYLILDIFVLLVLKYASKFEKYVEQTHIHISYAESLHIRVSAPFAFTLCSDFVSNQKVKVQVKNLHGAENTLIQLGVMLPN